MQYLDFRKKDFNSFTQRIFCFSVLFSWAWIWVLLMGGAQSDGRSELLFFFDTPGKMFLILLVIRFLQSSTSQPFLPEHYKVTISNDFWVYGYLRRSNRRIFICRQSPIPAFGHHYNTIVPCFVPREFQLTHTHTYAHIYFLYLFP